MMNQNVIVILVALAFGAIGFTLGRVTGHGPKGCCDGGHGKHGKHGKHGACEAPHEIREEVRVIKGEGEDEVQVLVDGLLESGFEGDTTLVIEGGMVKVSSEGGEVQVEVEMEGGVDGGGDVVEKEIEVVVE